jgi:hypothetical protein
LNEDAARDDGVSSTLISRLHDFGLSLFFALDLLRIPERKDPCFSLALMALFPEGFRGAP